MKKLLFILFLFSGVIQAQTPDATTKTNINNWIRNASLVTHTNEATIFDELNYSKISRIENNSASGTNIYTASISWVTAYAIGLNFPIVFTHANTGASTLNINGLGAITLKKNGSSALVSGDISLNQTHWLWFDGVNFQVLTIGGGAAGLSVGGDLSGTLPNPSVIKINGNTIPSDASGVLTNNGSGTLTWAIPISSFQSLTDGPGSFAGKSLNYNRVNVGETALEYRTSSQVLSDIGGQTALSGTGYSKFSGSSVSYNATIPNADLTNSTISGISLGSNLANLSIGAELISGGATTYNGSAAKTLTIQSGSVINAMLAGSIDATKINTGVVSNTEFNYLDGVTSAIQTQIDSKQATGNYITALTGDVTASGPGSVASTISTGAVTDDKASLLVKPAVAVISVSNLTLSGEQTIDGQLTSGSLVLLTAQTSGAENGPWVTASGAWSRPTWYTNGSTTQAPRFLTTFVRLGTTYQGTTWRMTTASVTIGTTATTWVETPLVLNSTNLSGFLPKANGGTGEDNSTGGTANQFWARPNGSTGAASYRAIVAADVPTLNQNTTGSAATLTTSRNLWGQGFNGSADVTGSLTSVGDITGGTSNMTITAGTGNSRTLTLKTTTSGGTATIFLSADASQVITMPHYTTNGGILYGDGSGVLSQTGAGTSTQVLHGGTSPSYSSVSLTADVTGILPIANGGTNNGSLSVTAGSVYYGDGSKLIALAPGTDGQRLEMNGTTAIRWAASNPYTIPASMATAGFNPADGATHYFGITPATSALTAASLINQFVFPTSCTITSAFFTMSCSGSPTNENISLYIRVNDTTDNLIATTATGATNTQFQNTGLSITINANDFIEMKMVCPTWSTNPTGCRIGGYVRAK